MKTCEDIAVSIAESGKRREAAPFRLLTVEGPDAVDFLHRLSTQAIAGLPIGGCALTAFLNAKGKLLFTTAVARFGGEHLGVEVAADQADELYEMLDRFHFTERLTIAREDAPCGEWVRAATAEDLGQCAVVGGRKSWQWQRGGVVFGRVQADTEGSLGEAWADSAHGELTEDDAEVLRIATGRVAVGRDSDASTLGMEAHLDDHVSFDKGCYTGQEIVARIQTYGHVNRRLVALLAPPIEAPDIGTPLCEPSEGDPVGRWMTSAALPDGQRLGLGYLPKDFWSAGTELTLGDGAGPRISVMAFVND